MNHMISLIVLASGLTAIPGVPKGSLCSCVVGNEKFACFTQENKVKACTLKNAEKDGQNCEPTKRHIKVEVDCLVTNSPK
jgi:hypothetical protein